MSKRNGRFYAAFGIAALLLAGAPAATAQNQPKASTNEGEASPKAKTDSDESLSAYERESLIVDRAGNRIAESANLIAEDQRSYAFAQTVLGAFGVGFTALAAIAAIAAAIYARQAAKAAGASAEADNKALAITVQAAADAREEAAAQSKRFDDQMSLARQNYVAEQRPWVGIHGITLGDLEIDDTGARLKVVLEVRNSGKTPAHRLGIKGRLIAEKRPEATVEDMIRRFAHQPRAPAEEDAMTCVFPQQKHPISVKVLCPPEEIAAARAGVMVPTVAFTLLGFLLYESELGEASQVHATTFAYRIFSKRGGAIPLDSGNTFEIIPGSELAANQWPYGWLAD